jgi:DNA-binding beta-propeller fold protein YncE
MGMISAQLRIWVIICSALLAAVCAPSPSGQSLSSAARAQSAPATAPRGSRRIFTQPVLVKNSPTNLGAFDVSWNDNSTQRYYLADRTNNAIDLVDSATDTFLGFIGHGEYTGSRPCPGQPHEMRHCAGPNGVVTDDLGHVWAGDGDGHLIEADATKPGTAIIRSIPTGGKGRVDEMAYDPIDQILMAENDGDSPPFLTFVSVTDGSVLAHYVYPKEQDGMEQPVWVRQTSLFYQNVPGNKNRIDVFDPRRLPTPVKSFPVECTGGLLGLTLSGLTVGPNEHLMAVCGSVGGVAIDPAIGRIQKIIPEGADADEVWYDPGSNNYYFSRSAASGGVAVVSAATEEFIANIPLGGHSVAVNANNKHVFVPVAGKGIFVIAPRK